MAAKRLSLTLKISFIAVWLAPPPIQLPAMVDKPRHSSDGSTAIKPGATEETSSSATGPPRMMPRVAAKNMMSALGPKLIIPFKSMPRHSSIKLAGSR